jgi:Fe-S-cluster containining protein
MIRNIGLEDISDGRLYSENDLVRTDTNNCSGCKKICCIGMGKTIVLDPYDCSGTGKAFEALVNDNIELNVVDGCILPNIKMQDKTNACSFLNTDNMCSIHGYRPGICRMFPLGRYWEDDEHFHYILQKGECNKDNLTKIKVKKWLGISDTERYNDYIIRWHKYLKKIQRSMKDLSQEEIRTLNLYNLKTFYMKAYVSEDTFFDEVKERIDKSEDMFGL